MTDIFNTPEMTPIRRKLRRQPTQAEIVLWSRLRNRQVHDFKFRRQYSVDRDVTDFFCAEVQLAVEADGYTHTFDEQWKKDQVRQRDLEALGIVVLRFTDDEVVNSTDAVIEQIATVALGLREKKPHPDPLLGKERE